MGSCQVPFTGQCPHPTAAGTVAYKDAQPPCSPGLCGGGDASHPGGSPQPTTDTGVLKASASASRWAHLCGAVCTPEFPVGSGRGRAPAETAQLLPVLLLRLHVSPKAGTPKTSSQADPTPSAFWGPWRAQPPAQPPPTWARSSSWSVFTPKRGTLESFRLLLCASLFTPVI